MRPRKILSVEFLAPVLLALATISVVGYHQRDLPFKAHQERSFNSPRLVSIKPLLVSIKPLIEEGEICTDPDSSESPNLASLGAGPTITSILAQRAMQEQRPARLDRGPARMIIDTSPTFSNVVVDVARNEVIAAGENTFQVLVYDRRANTPTNATMTEPKRVLGGNKTKIDYVCGLHVDPSTGDIYILNDDTETTLSVYSRDDQGNIPADRELKTPIYTFGLAVDEEHQELYMTVQRDGAVSVFRKQASGDEAPIRLLQGPRTRLADPHGIAIDSTNDLMFVTNFGYSARHSTEGVDLAKILPKPNWPIDNRLVIPGSGKFEAPSVTVHERTASGDTPPLRVIQGPKTRLNMPAGIAADPKRREIYVANDMDHSILVFSSEAGGDVAPLRLLKGSKTGLKHPSGLFLDTKNNELWVANFGNHSLTVYPLSAQGDTAPLRTIRSAPLGSPTTMVGNPGAVAYDTKRSELLVPN
ncbi:MAG: beta-propeller fold lactonase family protein [Acidobacteria bacterium]|nr:beta-propeller fold lactonase family protein [Acidobacteriota bacterium]